MMQSTYAKSNKQEVSVACAHSIGEGQLPEKMQGHWVMAHAGKRVLRPGGLDLTRRMLDALAISSPDRVVEFAPGFGITARLVLRKRPVAYWGVEWDPAAADFLERNLSGTAAKIIRSCVEESGLPSACASIVYGEAILSMQSPEQKCRAFAEARRLLCAGGRYGIHELCFLPGDISYRLRHEIQAAMSKEIHVRLHPLPRNDWVGAV